MQCSHEECKPRSPGGCVPTPSLSATHTLSGEASPCVKCLSVLACKVGKRVVTPPCGRRGASEACVLLPATQMFTACPLCFFLMRPLLDSWHRNKGETPQHLGTLVSPLSLPSLRHVIRETRALPVPPSWPSSGPWPEGSEPWPGEFDRQEGQDATPAVPGSAPTSPSPSRCAMPKCRSILNSATERIALNLGHREVGGRLRPGSMDTWRADGLSGSGSEILRTFWSFCH